MHFAAVRFGVIFWVAVSLGMGFPAEREARAAAGNDAGNDIGYETGLILVLRKL